jgi:hypothetical protein
LQIATEPLVDGFVLPFFSPKQQPPFAHIVVFLSIATSQLLGAQQPRIGEVTAADATVDGSVTLASGVLNVGSGSTVRAGDHAANIRLQRGGELRVCPRTALSLNSSQNGNELLLGMSTGAMEGDYTLPASADVIMTPDLRILLSGPGHARVSVTANGKGDTCVRSLGEGSYIIVNSLLTNDTYRVKPNEQVFFPAAQINQASEESPLVCGCPTPPPVKRAEWESPKPSMPNGIPKEPTALAATNPEAPLPPSKPDDVKVQVEAPFVFHGDEPQPDVTVTLARVHMDHLPAPPVPALAANSPETHASIPQTPVLPNGKAVTASNRGFFRKIGGFFAMIFGGK